jgi:hypothetical protein
VSTDGSCAGSFNVSFPISGGETVITATATDPANNTSEFSTCLSATGGGGGEQFFTVPPCRAADTRGAAGPNGGPALAGGVNRTFVIGGQCGIPTTATAVAFNFTATQPTRAGDLRVFPAGSGLPLVSTLNWSVGQMRANNAVVGLGHSADLTVHPDPASGTVQLIIDVTGYFQ